MRRLPQRLLLEQLEPLAPSLEQQKNLSPPAHCLSPRRGCSRNRARPSANSIRLVASGAPNEKHRKNATDKQASADAERAQTADKRRSLGRESAACSTSHHSAAFSQTTGRGGFATKSCTSVAVRSLFIYTGRRHPTRCLGWGGGMGGLAQISRVNTTNTTRSEQRCGR